MQVFTADDERWMRQALSLAASAIGLVEPNPMVGCVLVKSNQQMGAGYHKRCGGPHAEVEAIASVGGHDLTGATAYVTLEPCCHFGKTPPCTQALIAARIGRVVAAMQDIDPRVAGRGLDELRRAGIDVQCGLLETEARQLNAPYLKRQASGLPWVIGKWAMSLDGKIATRSGHSQWISSAASRALVHQMRGRVDAIVVGCRTALADDPLLTARPAGPRSAVRVVLDSKLQLPLTSQLVRTAKEVPVLLWARDSADRKRASQLEKAGCKVAFCTTSSNHYQSATELLHHLAQDYQATNVLVEGGGETLASFLEASQLDQLEVFIANKLIGGSSAPTPIGGQGFELVDHSPQLRLVGHNLLQDDLHVSYRVERLPS